MVKHSVAAAFLTICGVLGSVPAVAAQDNPRQSQWSVIEDYCIGCHNNQVRAGGKAFDLMSPDRIALDAETWEAAIRKLRGGLMPPAGARRPDSQSVAELVSWLENEIDTGVGDPEPGRVALRRLNRREYAYAIRDLLGFNIDAEALLPEDNIEGNFDNNAAALQVSPSFVDQYVYAARAVALEAVGNPETPAVTTTYGDVANMVISLPPRGAPGTGKQQHRIEGMPFGTRGGFIVEHNFPADGEYELTIGDMALAREVPRMEFENTVIALLDGEEFYRTNLGGEADHKAIDQLLDPAVEEINGRLRKIRFTTTAGQHRLAVTFLHRTFAESDERTRTIALEGGQERIHAAHALQIRGPLSVTGISESVSREKIFICQPSETVDATSCAEEIIGNLARRAFRRPVTDEDVNLLMPLYDSGYALAGFEGGVRDALSAILASPHFLYRAESGDEVGGTRTLSDLELASRLSFFLWSSLPDEELLNLAIESRLSDPGVLGRQVSRMLADPRAINLLMPLYESGYALAGFEGGVRDALSAILASPHFLYRAESGIEAGGTRTLSDLELASRLSFFLWSSLPDEELLNLAIESRLGDPGVLGRQVSRMLADPRAMSLIDDFAFQWLDLAKLDEITPDRGQFPHASGLLDPRAMLKEELRLFIDSVLRSERSVVELLTADHTFLNERLAMHYGIETVKGSRFRRVTLNDTARHGLLGKGAILMATAYPNRTSPVLRGAWILDRVLGAPSPEPPPDVEPLPENSRGQPAQTLRERLEQHRANPTCFACHGVMDPLGLALENFSAVGQFRTNDPETRTLIDTSGLLPDGTPIGGPEDLRRALVARPERFVQAFTENLLTYALGRGIDYRDMPTVREIVRRAEADDSRFEAIVLGIVSSDAFRKREALASQSRISAE